MAHWLYFVVFYLAQMYEAMFTVLRSPIPPLIIESVHFYLILSSIVLGHDSMVYTLYALHISYG